MADIEHQPPAWLDQALINPGSIFARPEDVADSPDLSLEDKVRVLRSWEYDSSELAVAEEEGMQGARNGLLRRILLALAGLTDDQEMESVAPSKQHGLPDRPG